MQIPVYDVKSGILQTHALSDWVVKHFASSDAYEKSTHKKGERKNAMSFEQVQGCNLPNIYIYIYICMYILGLTNLL